MTRALKLLVLSLLCLHGAFLASRQLILDLKRSLSPEPLAPLARLESRETGVRRKPGNSFLWIDVTEGADFFRRDSVHVGRSGSAVLALKDGSRLELGPDSLVILDEVPPLELTYMRGTFVWRTPREDFAIRATDGKKAIERLPIRLVSPAPLTRLVVPPGGKSPVFFQWSSGAADGAPRLEISPSLDFPGDRAKRVTFVDWARSQQVLELGAGTWYWRVARGDYLSETRKIEILEASQPVPLFPSPGETVFLPEKSSPLSFRWSVPSERAAAAAETGVFELSRSPSFLRDVTKRPVPPGEQRLSIAGLERGKWFWRVQVKYATFSTASKPVEFEVKEGQGVTLLSPPPQSSQKLGEVELSWDLPAGGEGAVFHLEVEGRDDADSFRRVLATETAARHHVWKAKEAGVYRWRVAMGYGGSFARPTDWRHFSIYEGDPIALKAPEDGAAIRFWSEPARVVFQWAEDPLARRKGYRYRLRISPDREAASGAKDHFTVSPRADGTVVGLAPGAHFWRVDVVEPGGLVVKSSEVRRLDYGPPPPLVAPLLEEPIETGVFELRRLETPPRLKWAPVPHATRYAVRVIQDGGRAITSLETSETSLPLRDLGPGRYRWSVRAVDPIGRLGEEGPWRRFSVQLGDLLEAPKVKETRVE